MDPLATPLPNPNPIPAVAVATNPMHPAKTTPATHLTSNDRHKEGHEPREGPENNHTIRDYLMKTTDDRPRFGNVNHRPVFFPLPMSPNWFHLGSSCAPIARQVEPVQRPLGVYLGPFNGSTKTGKTQNEAETIIRVIRTTTACVTDPYRTTSTRAAIHSDARRRRRSLDTRWTYPRRTTNGERHTYDTQNTAHQQETLIMNEPTGLIPDRGKTLHTTPTTTKTESPPEFLYFCVV